MHCKVEIGVVTFYSPNKIINDYFGIQFFTYFTYQCLLRRLTCFHFASRELPPILEFAVSTLGGEYFIATFDDSRYYFYPFHNVGSGDAWTFRPDYFCP